jgi:hypothetical protein
MERILIHLNIIMNKYHLLEGKYHRYERFTPKVEMVAFCECQNQSSHACYFWLLKLHGCVFPRTS